MRFWLTLLLFMWCADAQAQTPELARLFPKQAEVSAPKGEGLARLRLPPEVLQDTRGDLADVRLLDADGHEVPFLLDSARRPLWLREPRLEQEEGELLAVDQRRTYRSGRWYHEELIVEAPSAPSPSGHWDLVFEVRRHHFVSQLRVVDPDQPDRVLAKASVFRLQGPLREGVRVALPEKLPKRLRLILRGDQRYLEPVVRYQATRAPAATRLTLPLTEVGRETSGGTTTLVLTRPRGIVPDRIEIRSDTGTFHRRLTVRDAGQGQNLSDGGVLGEQVAFRVADLEGVEQLGVWIDAPSGDRLELGIDDGDSPPLQDLKAFAVIDQPALVFELEGRGTLLFGGGRAHAPGYDLQRLIGTDAGEALALRGALRDATLSAVAENPAFDPAPALGFLMRPGPPMDTHPFSHRRRIEVKHATEGAARLRLKAEDLAKARADLGDLRVLDDQGRQQPYLIERRAEDARLVSVAPPQRHEDGSHYRVVFPASPLSVRRLTLDVRERYFDRPYQLRSDGVTIAAGNLRRPHGERAAIALRLPSDERLRDLTLVVDDGDDAPLTIDGAEIRVPSADLYVVAPAGFYWLMLGDPGAEPARYEVSRARDLVLALPSEPIVPGALDDNPSYAPPKPEQDDAPRLVMWAVLALAVAALGALTFRAAKAPTPRASDATEP